MFALLVKIRQVEKVVTSAFPLSSGREIRTLDRSIIIVKNRPFNSFATMSIIPELIQCRCRFPYSSYDTRPMRGEEDIGGGPRIIFRYSNVYVVSSFLAQSLDLALQNKKITFQPRKVVLFITRHGNLAAHLQRPSPTDSLSNHWHSCFG